MPTSPSDTAALSTWMPLVRVSLIALFVLAIPLLLVGTNLRWMTQDRQLYLDGFAKYGASARTGLEQAQLERVADAFIDYFRSPPGRMDLTVTIGGQTRPLFNERELAHMEDVQAIVQGFYRAQLVSGGILLAVVALGFLLWRQAFVPTLGWMAIGGAGLTLGILLLVGLLSTLDFQDLWVRFHQVSFRNDLWMLDPSRDYLIMLFPIGFWFDATVRLATLTAVEAAVLGLAGFGLLKLPLSSPR